MQASRAKTQEVVGLILPGTGFFSLSISVHFIYSYLTLSLPCLPGIFLSFFRLVHLIHLRRWNGENEASTNEKMFIHLSKLNIRFGQEREREKMMEQKHLRA